MNKKSKEAITALAEVMDKYRIEIYSDDSYPTVSIYIDDNQVVFDDDQLLNYEVHKRSLLASLEK